MTAKLFDERLALRPVPSVLVEMARGRDSFYIPTLHPIRVRFCHEGSS